VLAAVAKQPYVANLASFELGGGCAAKATAALPLLSLASRLETLQIDNESATFVLRSLANAWREKRGGAAQPLLRSLKFVGWSSMSKSICPKLFCELSELFPELEELHTAFSLSSTCLSVTSAHAARPCLRLRRLCLDSLVCVRRRQAGESFGHRIGLIERLAPPEPHYRRPPHVPLAIREARHDGLAVLRERTERSDRLDGCAAAVAYVVPHLGEHDVRVRSECLSLEPTKRLKGYQPRAPRRMLEPQRQIRREGR
jgi:hypothetical protein